MQPPAQRVSEILALVIAKINQCCITNSQEAVAICVLVGRRLEKEQRPEISLLGNDSIGSKAGIPPSEPPTSPTLYLLLLSVTL